MCLRSRGQKASVKEVQYGTDNYECQQSSEVRMLVLTATKHRMGIIYWATLHRHFHYYMECSVCMLLHCRCVAAGRRHFSHRFLSHFCQIYLQFIASITKIVLTRWVKFAAFNFSPPQTQLGAHNSLSDSLTRRPLHLVAEERSRKEDGYMSNPLFDRK